MKFSEIELPSNKKFGFFFAIVFALAAAYFYKVTSMAFASTFSFISVIFMSVAIFKSDFLLPLNKLWMRFGFLLGMIVSPIVLGIIFFGIFTPVALLMRFFGRDELRLKCAKETNHWISRSEPIKSENFRNQF